ncbi:M14 family zinc carboxypeptidase [Halobacteriovorax sp. HLS]|uniref:M14 family zinc carboxypeptidase n=1 Tax=Halobacteriovorax sp. HLS TaxID=2234000 RepID=UPI000FDCD8AD|nr:M14 family zinc carboxypeptidase [Halobacteriovorax sp. HLS]
MKISLVLVLSLITLVANAETIKSFSVSKSNSKISEIATSFEIVENREKDFIVYVLDSKTDKFNRMAPLAKLISEDINKELKNKSQKIQGYHSFEEVQSIAKELEQSFPTLAKIEHYGTSKNGLPLFALKITKDAKKSNKVKKSMLTSATHGDELITVEVLLSLSRMLLESYGKDDRLTRIVDESETYFIFVVNPEGFTRRSRYAGGIDPNRQYPWPGNPNRSTPVKSIDSLMKFYKEKDFKGSIDFHAYGKMVMFPWGYTRDLINSSDHEHFNLLTKDMAKENRYKSGPISRVIYVAKGSSADFYYEHNGGSAIAVELGNRKVPHHTKIAAVVEQAREMTWKFLDSIVAL